MTDAGGIELHQLGWDDGFAAALADRDDPTLVPARVGIEHNHLYRIYTAEGERLAESAGSLRHAATGPEELPAVGDWVGVQLTTETRAVIRVILPRRSCFSRKAAGSPTQRQVVAANIDTVFLVSGLDGDFNPKRIERYLVAVAESGAEPVIVLNKADECEAVDAAVGLVRAVAGRVPVHVTSCLASGGVDRLAPYLQPGRTVTLLGSSGVGKSTIINRLLGRDRQATGRVRRGDKRGRHTTVHRELMVRPEGGIIIDTPGMRELQLWNPEPGLDTTFDDIEALAEDCRFRDCRHRTEPGCAVRRAVAEGRLPAGRLDSYHKLSAEQVALQRRREQLARLDERRRTKEAHRALRTARKLPKS